MPLFRKRKRTYKRRPYKKRTYKRKYPKRKYGYKKRSYKRRRTRGHAFTKRQKAYLQKALRNSGDQDNVQVYRTLTSGAINSKVNNKFYDEFSFLDRSFIDLALTTYNSPNQTTAGNTQMVLGSTKSLTGVDKNIKTKILSAYFEMKFRNNSTVPTEMVFYHLAPRKRMAIDDGPKTEIDEGLINSGTQTGTLTDLRYSPYDSPQFLRFFKILKVTKKKLKVGQEYIHRMRRVSPFVYSAADSVNHTASHSDPAFTQWLLVDQRGCIGRSNTDDNVGVSEATVDYTIMRQIKFANTPNKLKSRYLSGGEYLPALETVPIHRQLCTETASFSTSYPNNEQVVIAVASSPAVVNALSTQDSKLDQLITAQEETTQAIEDLPGPP